MTPEVHAALAAAADNDLYRVCGPVGQPAVFRTRSGRFLNTHSVVVAVAGGMLGTFATAELLGDGVWVQRLDLSEAGLDYFLAVTR